MIGWNWICVLAMIVEAVCSYLAAFFLARDKEGLGGLMLGIAILSLISACIIVLPK